MAEPTLDLAELTSLVRDKIALSDIAFEGSSKPRFVAFGYSDAKDILNALERAEKDREYLREKNDLIRAYAGPTGMTPEDVAAALERVPELERQVANLEADLHSQDADYWRERAERVEAAARELYEFYGEDADVFLGPELRSTLAAAPAKPGKLPPEDYTADEELFGDGPAAPAKEGGDGN